jgi:hypothetical protein
LGERRDRRKRARGDVGGEPARTVRVAHAHTNLRLSFDQPLENLTGAGAPPWTWPGDELAIDVSHKALYSLVTGAISDALIAPAQGSSARRRALDRRLKGPA